MRRIDRFIIGGAICATLMMFTLSGIVLAKGGKVIADYLAITVGTAPAVSQADEGRIYYNQTSDTFQASENGGPYRTMTKGVPDNSTFEQSGDTLRIKDLGVTTGKINDDAVTDAKIRESAALSIIGNATNGAANPTDIAAGSDNQVLRRSGTSIGFGTVAIAGGGTGQTTATAAFDALAPTTTQGDLIYYNGTDNVRLGANGTGDNNWLRSVSGGNPSWNAITVQDVTGLGTGGVLYGNASVGTALAIGTAGQVLTVNAGATAPEWKTPSSLQQNILINGGFEIAQRGTSLNLNTTAVAYTADRWKAQREGATGTTRLTFARSDATGEASLTSKNYASYTRAFDSGKIAVYQIVEGANVVPLRGRSIVWKAKLRSLSGTPTYRMGVFDMSGGTMDTVATLFSDMTTAAGTDPTLDASLDDVAATAITGGSINAGPGQSALDCSLTTTWTTYAVSVTVPSDSQNLIFAIWSNADVGAAEAFRIAEADVHLGTGTQTWTPRPFQQEFALCQRYYQKTYSWDITPGTATTDGALRARSNGTTAGSVTLQWIYKVTMRTTTPTVTPFSTSSGTPDNMRDLNAGADEATAEAYANDSSVLIYNTTTIATDNNECVVQATADAEL
jgi:hypothetical protein